MIIFANGAHKSGSTWLMHLVLELRPCAEPPERYRNLSWKTPPYYSISQQALPDMLADGDVLSRDILFKLHIQSPTLRDLVLAHPAVRTLNIRRDLRDVELADIATLERAVSHPLRRLALHAPAPLRPALQFLTRRPRPIPELAADPGRTPA